MSNSLVIQGKQVTVPNYSGAINDKGSLVGARIFICEKFGLKAEDVAEVTKKAEWTALIKAANPKVTDVEIKAADKEYRQSVDSYQKDSRNLTALLIADPSFRARSKVNRNKAGEAVGLTTVFRKEKSPKASLQNENEILKNRIAQLEALMLPAAAQA